MLGEFTLSSRLVDAIIVLTVIEAAVLFFYHRLTRRGLAPQDYLLNLMAGLWLMLALRSALVSAGWMWIAACLAGAGLAHTADIVLRWKRADARLAEG